MDKRKKDNEIRISDKVISSRRLLSEQEIEEEIELQLAEFEKEIPNLLEENEREQTEDTEPEIEIVIPSSVGNNSTYQI